MVKVKAFQFHFDGFLYLVQNLVTFYKYLLPPDENRMSSN
jgi:hypothetical protein